MKNAKRISSVWLALAVFAAVSALLGTPLLAFLALTGRFIPMGIMMPIVGHGYLGFGFYFRAFYRAKLCGRLSELIRELDTRDPEVLGDEIGLIPSAVTEALLRAEKKGYI